MCGPYSQCLQVDNLKSRRSEDGDYPHVFLSSAMARGIQRYQTRLKTGGNRDAPGNSTQTVLCACLPNHIGAPPKCRPLACANNNDCPNQFACVK